MIHCDKMQISRKELKEIKGYNGRIERIFLNEETIPYYLKIQWDCKSKRYKVSFYSVCCNGFNFFTEKDLMFMIDWIGYMFGVVSVP